MVLFEIETIFLIPLVLLKEKEMADLMLECLPLFNLFHKKNIAKTWLLGCL